jgi:hypothetical protein
MLIGAATGFVAVLLLAACSANQPPAGHVGLQANLGQPYNTSNDDRDEASSEKGAGGCLLGGKRIRSWVSWEAHGCVQRQVAHGYNPNGPDHRATDDGHFTTVALTTGPRVAVPGLVVEPYASVEIGPAVTWLDTDLQDRTRFQPSGRAAVGLERWFGRLGLRLEASYLHTGTSDDEALREGSLGLAVLWGLP